MNFLAHIFLSGENPKITVGNFIGDFVKRNQLDAFEPEIQLGVRLHRHIDHFTDTHDIVLRSKERLRPNYHHYSPVIVDVFYDHFLAKDWLIYSGSELETYTKEFYLLIDTFKSILPADANHMLTYMKRDNWLFNYRLTEGIRQSFIGMSRRTSFNSKMEFAVNDLIKDYELFAEEFHEFFPVLQAECQNFLNKEA